SLVRRALEHADKGVLRQVGGIPAVAQAPAQQAEQPGVVAAVELTEGSGGSRHNIQPALAPRRE
ncbi:hypothetical protein O6455_24585, partial [Salmonella enterica subsp. enterica]